MRGWADFCFLFPTDDAYEKKADHFRKQPSNNPSAFSGLLPARERNNYRNINLLSGKNNAGIDSSGS